MAGPEAFFQRMVGIVTPDAIHALAETRIGIAGCGGTGGSFAIMLARMGVGSVRLADGDTYEAANISRQAGAFQSTLGMGKADTIAAMVRDINPDAEVEVMDGLTEKNVVDFVAGRHIVIDAIDLLAWQAKLWLYDAARSAGTVAVGGACPLGWGAAVTVFGPHTPNFREFFEIDGDMDRSGFLQAVGRRLFPSQLSSAYAPGGSLQQRDGHEYVSAVAPAIELATALVGAEVFSIMTNEGREPTWAPATLEIDLMERAAVARGSVLRDTTGRI